MMKFHTIILLILLGLFAGCQTVPRTMSDARAGIDFSTFSSFAVLPIPLDAKISDPPIGPNMMNVLIAQVRDKFKSSGYREAPPQQADLHIVISGQIVSRTDKYDWGYTPADRWYRYRGLDRIQLEVGNKGTLIVDVLRRMDGELLWRGWASRDINGYLPEDQALVRDLGKILAQFPPVLTSKK